MSAIESAVGAAVKLLLPDSKDTAGNITDTLIINAVRYLHFFGYVSSGLLNSLDVAELKQRVTLFQQRFGLPADGVIGPKTLKAIAAPRCGCLDVADNDNGVHLQYLRLQEKVDNNKNRWQKNGLTYAVREYVPGIPPEQQRQIIHQAWAAWDKVCGLELREATSADTADLLLRVGRGSVDKFDGRGGVLAWSYLPDGTNKQLLMRFDTDETWVTTPEQRGVLLFNVACHEFGHMLGLSHSEIAGALMAPHYNPLIAVPQQKDDIDRVTAIYGRDPVAVTATPEKTLVIRYTGDIRVEGLT